MAPDYGVTIDWASPDTAPAPAVCRACGAPGAKPVLLEAEAVLPQKAPLHARFLGCPDCGCAFDSVAAPFDYVHQPTTALTIANYAEAGAGLWPIVRTLAQLTLPPSATLLEIGCGVGFGLDFAIHGRGWRARGIDPSPMAAAGRDLLGVPIEVRYFGDAPGDVSGVDGKADCILASEVLEHMADPRGFVALLRGALADDGVLVMTTPDRALLRRDAQTYDLVSLLSVGTHLVLFTAAGLRALLLAQGFAHVEVAANGAQLTAYASAAPLRLERRDDVLRGAYRAYLARRADMVPPGGVAWWAFAVRAHQEAVVDHDTATADRLWVGLRAACRDKFGFDPDEPAAVPIAAGCDLAGLAAIVPHALPTLLYARALHRLHRGESPAAVAGTLACVAPAAAALNAALLQVGSVDLAAIAAARAALAALAALAAEIAAADSLDALAQAVAADPAASRSLARASYVRLVNAGDFAKAAALRARWDIGAGALDAGPRDQPMPAADRDTLFCLAMADLHEAGSEERAMHRFSRVRAASSAKLDGVWWSALRGECIAADRLGRHEHGTALLREAPADGMPEDLRARLAG